MKAQIQNRIDNLKRTIDDLKPEQTDWHRHQVSILEAKIEQLQWVMEFFPEVPARAKTPLFDKNMLQELTIEEMFLDQHPFYQKDSNGLYTYISENELHMINIAATLEDFKNYLNNLNNPNPKP